MTERTETLEQWAQRVEGVRRKIEALSIEEQEQGARFTERYWALNAAVKELRGEQRISSEDYRDDVAEALAELREEIGAEFRAWQEARGIPELWRTKRKRRRNDYRVVAKDCRHRLLSHRLRDLRQRLQPG